MLTPMKFTAAEPCLATAGADTAEIFSKCSWLVRQTAREFNDQPLYITLPPANHVGCGDCLAFVEPRGSYQITAHLIEQGIWAGAGNTIVLTDLNLPLERLLAISLHEAAHLLPLKSPGLRSCVEPSRSMIERERAAMQTAIQEEVKTKSKGWPQWFPHHGRSFTRFMAHLTWRAAEHGLDHGWMYGCFSGAQYSMAEPWDFVAALRNEPARLANCTFAEIENTPEPAAFGELFIESTRNFMRKQNANSSK